MYNLLLDSLAKHVSLTREEKDLLMSFFEPKTFRKKEYMLRAGEVLRHAVFVARGCFTTYSVDKAGKTHVAQIAVEGWWAGDIYSFLSQEPSEYFVESIENSEVLQTSKEKLEELYVKIPKLERYFRILVQNAYISFRNRIVSTMSKPAEERYLKFIQTYPGLEQRVPQYIIASYLGIRPEFLSRIRKNLARRSIS